MEKYHQYKIQNDEETQELIDKLNDLHDWITYNFNEKQNYKEKQS